MKDKKKTSKAWTMVNSIFLLGLFIKWRNTPNWNNYGQLMLRKLLHHLLERFQTLNGITILNNTHQHHWTWKYETSLYRTLKILLKTWINLLSKNGFSRPPVTLAGPLNLVMISVTLRPQPQLILSNKFIMRT